MSSSGPSSANYAKSLQNNPVYQGRKQSNRELLGSQTRCGLCDKVVFELEKVVISGRPLHAACFRCHHDKCHRKLNTLDFVVVGDVYYCNAHGKEMVDADSKRLLTQRRSSAASNGSTHDVVASANAAAAEATSAVAAAVSGSGSSSPAGYQSNAEYKSGNATGIKGTMRRNSSASRLLDVDDAAMNQVGGGIQTLLQKYRKVAVVETKTMQGVVNAAVQKQRMGSVFDRYGTEEINGNDSNASAVLSTPQPKITTGPTSGVLKIDTQMVTKPEAIQGVVSAVVAAPVEPVSEPNAPDAEDKTEGSKHGHSHRSKHSEGRRSSRSGEGSSSSSSSRHKSSRRPSSKKEKGEEGSSSRRSGGRRHSGDSGDKDKDKHKSSSSSSSSGRRHSSSKHDKDDKESSHHKHHHKHASSKDDEKEPSLFKEEDTAALVASMPPVPPPQSVTVVAGAPVNEAQMSLLAGDLNESRQREQQLRKLLKMADREVKERGRLVRKLERQVEAGVNSADTRGDYFDELESKVTAAESSVTDLTQERDLLLRQVARANGQDGVAENAELDQLAQRDAKIVKLSSSVNTLKSANIKVSASLADETMENGKLVELVNILEAELNEFTATARDQDRELREARARNDSLAEQLKSTSSSLVLSSPKAVTASMQILSERVREQQEELLALSEQLAGEQAHAKDLEIKLADNYAVVESTGASRVDELTAQVKRLSNERQHLVTRLADSEMATKTKQGEYTSGQTSKDELITDLRQQLDEALNARTKLSEAQANLAKQLGEAGAHTNEAEEQVHVLEREFVAYRADTDALLKEAQMQMDTLSERADELEKNNDDAEGRYLEALEEARVAHEDASVSARQAHDLRMEMERMRGNGDETHQTLTAVELQLVTVKERAVRAEEMCNEQRTQLDKQLTSMTRGTAEKGLDTARRLGRAEGDNKVLRQKVEQLDISLAERRTAVQDLSDKLYTVEGKAWAMAEESKTATERVEKLEKLKEESDRELKVADRSVKNLREELENLHAELEGSVAARSKEATSMHSSVSAMTEQIGNLEVEKEELEHAVARLLDEVKTTRARSTEAEAQLNVLEREREGLVTAREGLGQDKSMLHEQVIEMTENIAELDAQVRWGKDKISKQKVELDKLRVHIKELDRDLNTRDQQLKELSYESAQQAEEWESKRADIEEELRASAQRVADLEGSLELSRHNGKNLESELDESTHAHQLTRNELEALQDRTLSASGQLDDTVHALQTDKKALMESITRAAEENDTLTTEADVLRDTIARKNTDIKGLEAAHNKVEEARRKLLQQVTDAAGREVDLEGQMEQLTEELLVLRAEHDEAMAKSQASSTARRLMEVERELERMQEALVAAKEETDKVRGELDLTRESLGNTRHKLASLSDRNEDLQLKLDEADMVLESQEKHKQQRRPSDERSSSMSEDEEVR